MVKVSAKGTEPQNWMIRTCAELGPNVIVADCWKCKKPVVGIILPDRPGRYVMRCENCGRVESAYHDIDEYHENCWPEYRFYWQFIAQIGRG